MYVFLVVCQDPAVVYYTKSIILYNFFFDRNIFFIYHVIFSGCLKNVAAWFHLIKEIDNHSFL